MSADFQEEADANDQDQPEGLFTLPRSGGRTLPKNNLVGVKADRVILQDNKLILPLGNVHLCTIVGFFPDSFQGLKK